MSDEVSWITDDVASLMSKVNLDYKRLLWRESGAGRKTEIKFRRIHAVTCDQGLWNTRHSDDWSVYRLFCPKCKFTKYYYR